MPRRRPSFAIYARRRWRVLGLLLVLLAGSILIVAITDRGHDPIWEARGASVDQGAVSPRGDAVYALVREQGNITRLEARDGKDGRLLWFSPLHATRALLAAGDDGVAVATDFPLAFLTYYGKDHAVRYQIPLEGVPRAMAIDGPRLALALQAPNNPVLVVVAGRVVAVHPFGTFVSAIDFRGGQLAAGTGAGDVHIEDAQTGRDLYNGSFPISVRSLRLSHDGGALILGGVSLAPGNLSGGVAFVDLLGNPPLRWYRATQAGVSYVDLDRSGVSGLAVQDGPEGDTIEALGASTGAVAWERTVEGGLARGDADQGGGVALSSEGQVVAVGMLHGGITAYRMIDGTSLWTFRAQETTLVRFADLAPDTLMANGKLNAADPDGGLMIFSIAREPVGKSLPALVVLLALGFAAAGGLVLGVGYWRVRRSY